MSIRRGRAVSSALFVCAPPVLLKSDKLIPRKKGSFKEMWDLLPKLLPPDISCAELCVGPSQYYWFEGTRTLSQTEVQRGGSNRAALQTLPRSVLSS